MPPIYDDIEDPATRANMIARIAEAYDRQGQAVTETVDRFRNARKSDNTVGMRKPIAERTPEDLGPGGRVLHDLLASVLGMGPEATPQGMQMEQVMARNAATEAESLGGTTLEALMRQNLGETRPAAKIREGTSSIYRPNNPATSEGSIDPYEYLSEQSMARGTPYQNSVDQAVDTRPTPGGWDPIDQIDPEMQFDYPRQALPSNEGPTPESRSSLESLNTEERTGYGRFVPPYEQTTPETLARTEFMNRAMPLGSRVAGIGSLLNMVSSIFGGPYLNMPSDMVINDLIAQNYGPGGVMDPYADVRDLPGFNPSTGTVMA